MSYTGTKFPYYPNNINIVEPLGYTTLKEFVRAIREPREATKQLFADIKIASEKGDLKLKAELKKKLYYFTPCIDTDGKGRAYANITSFTGFMQIDFDGITYAAEFRDWFFKNVKSCVVCGISPSSFGIKALIRIPIVKTVDEFKSYFYGVSYYLEQYKGFDIAPQNCSLPLYMFNDPDARYREDAIVSTVRGEKINAFKKFEGEIEVLEDIESWKKERVKGIFIRGISNIVDNGHPQVVAYSSMLGGYCVSGYLSQDEAEVLIEEEINKSEYLSKDIKGYIRNAKNMLVRGMNGPLYLKGDNNE